MSANPSLVPSSAARSSRSRWRWICVGSLFLIAGGVAGWWWDRNYTPIVLPPDVDLACIDPEIADVLAKKRQQVLREPRSSTAWGELGQLFSTFNYRAEALACFAQAERLDARQPRWPYHQGILLLLDNPYEAIPHLQRAAELSEKTNAAPHVRLGEALLTLCRLEEAEQSFRAAMKRDPDNARVQLGLGRIALQREQWEQALTYLEKAAKNTWSARSAAIALAELHQRRGEESQADYWRQRSENLPSDARWPDPYLEELHRLQVGKRYRLFSANRLFEQGHAAEALALLHQLVIDYPQSSDAWFGLGQALYRAGNYPQAEQAMRKVLEIAPGYADAHGNLGTILMKQGKLAAAEKSLRRAIELKADFALAYINLGRCLLQQRDPAGAMEAFRSAAAAEPNNTTAYLELAETLHQAKRDGEALEQVRTALQTNPHDARAKQLLEKLTAKKN